ncbi:MAG: T9SS type A sorting domain-containing protein [Aureispira sp.]|nr:T9SS type A sorting domain-containing protein [Aureispira sp.]
MKNILLSTILSFFVFQILDAQIIYYHKHFDEINGVLPTGCSAIDEDLATPSNLAYGATWITKIVGNDTVAVSTSSYSPADTASDWLILHNVPVPAGAVTELRWDAMATDPNNRDGYEVYISTTGDSIHNFLASSPVFIDSAASPFFTQQSIEISSYFGQLVDIAFRNNSYDRDALYLDDIYAIALPAFEISPFESAPLYPQYSQVPINQLSGPPTLELKGTVRNNGGLQTSNVGMRINLYANGNSTVVFTGYASIDSLEMSDTAQFLIGQYTPPSLALGYYTAEYIVSMNETDAIPENDTLYQTFSITDSIIARDNSIASEYLSGNLGQASILGQNFDINTTTGLDAISFYVDNTNNQLLGQPIHAVVYDVIGNQPNSLIAVTDTTIITQSGGQWVQLPINNGPIALSAGQYYAGIAQTDSLIMLGASPNLFTSNTVWQNSNSTWTLNETLGYELSYLVRMHLTDTPPITNVLEVSSPKLTIQLSPNPCHSQLTIQSNSLAKKTAQYTIIDILGNSIEKGLLEWNQQETTLDISTISVGVYFIKLTIDKESISKPFIKN